ncbi:MAG: hypothetical protein AB1758_36125, partial [Candidatus Eremiobacterota bacterium]
MPSTSSEEDARNWAEAEALRKAGQWARAGRYFHNSLKERPIAGAAWRYAFCLRKAGYPEAALAMCQRAVDRWPDEKAVRWELVWCLYAARLRPAQEREDEEGVLQAAREMVRAGAEELPLQLAVFASVGAAKRKGHWGEVSGWCDRLDPLQLSAEPNRFEGRRIPSMRERWYYAKLKALVHLEEWEPGRVVARQAREQFPTSLDFRRWEAACLAGLGEVEAAVGLLEPHRAERRKQWYVLSDLA